MSGFGYNDVADQAWMLLDESRDAYADALREVITADSVVLDIGSGSGVWALLAAKLGARKVYAVERTVMAELITDMARENGVDDVVEVLHIDARALEHLDPKPNVVVSEMLGHFAPDENQHQLYRLAERLCVDGATFIPSAYSVELALADSPHLRREVERLQNYQGVSMAPLVNRLVNRTHLGAHDASMLLCTAASTDMVSSTAPLPETYEAKVTVSKAGRANAIVASFVAQLSSTVTLRTSVSAPRTHWQQTVFPLSPELDVDVGDDVLLSIIPRAVTNRDSYAWSAKSGDVLTGGDGMKALLGGKAAMLAALGFVLKQPELSSSKTMAHWRTALNADADNIEAMADAVYAAHPADFTEVREAKETVLDLLQKSGGLQLQ